MTNTESTFFMCVLVILFSFVVFFSSTWPSFLWFWHIVLFLIVVGVTIQNCTNHFAGTLSSLDSSPPLSFLKIIMNHLPFPFLFPSKFTVSTSQISFFSKSTLSMIAPSDFNSPNIISNSLPLSI